MEEKPNWVLDASRYCCRKCGVELVVPTTWTASYSKIRNRTCRACTSAYHRERNDRKTPTRIVYPDTSDAMKSSLPADVLAILDQPYEITTIDLRTVKKRET